MSRATLVHGWRNEATWEVMQYLTDDPGLKQQINSHSQWVVTEYENEPDKMIPEIIKALQEHTTYLTDRAEHMVDYKIMVQMMKRGLETVDWEAMSQYFLALARKRIYHEKRKAKQ